MTVKSFVCTSLSIIFGFFIFMFANARKRNIVFHDMKVGLDASKSKKRLTLFFISDIHRRKIDERLMRNVLAAGKFDLVIIGGDLAEKGVPLKRIEENIRQLARLGPIVYVWGNNDREVGEQAIRDIISRHGGKVLDNLNFPIPGYSGWGICGMDDPSSGKVDVDSALDSIEAYENVIVVTHTPSLFRKVEQVYKPRLMLAGHTHGGQIRIGRFGLQDKGEFRMENGRAKLISNGYGTTLLPLRLGAAAECHIITIR